MVMVLAPKKKAPPVKAKAKPKAEGKSESKKAVAKPAAA
jgi:hypothetical protein